VNSPDFQQSPIGQAVKQSVAQLAIRLYQKAVAFPFQGGLPSLPAEIPVGWIIGGTSTANVVISLGSNNGVKFGDTFVVIRAGGIVTDPVIGMGLSTPGSGVGNLTITSVGSDTAVGIHSGSGIPKIGDYVEGMKRN